MRVFYKILSSLCLLLLLKTIQAQELDSLVLQVKQTIDVKAKTDLLNIIAQKYSYIDNDSARIYAEQAYKESVAAGYQEGEVVALLRKCYYYIYTGNNQAALDLLKQSELICERSGNKILLGQTYMYYGDLFYHSLLFDKAFESYKNATAIFQRFNQENDYYTCINQMGVLYAMQNRFDEAQSLFNQALEGAIKIKSNDLESGILNSIATLYKNTNRLNEALEIYKKALKANLNNHNYKFATKNLGNIAFVYFALNDTTKALQYFDSTLIFASKVKDLRNELYTRINKSKILLFQNKYSLIEDELKKDLIIAQKSNWSDLSMECTSTLAELYARKKQYDSAYDYTQQYIKYYETLQSEGNTQKLSELQFKYNFEKEALVLEAESHRKSLLIKTLIALITLSVVIIIVLFIQYRTKSAKAILENKNLVLEKEKSNLQQENLTNQLELKNKEITSSIILLQKKNDILATIANKLMNAKNQFTQTNWQLIEKCIDELRENTDDKDRKNFELYFNQVYESFYKKLHEINPNLTPNDRRLCAYIKLQMSTKEIAALTNSSQRSVEVARYRLRKKLNMNNLSVSINSFLEEL